MNVTDLTGDTTDDGSVDSLNGNEMTKVCVTPTNSSRKSRDNLKKAICLPSINEKQSVSIFNAPKDWDKINQYRNHAFPYHLNKNAIPRTNTAENSVFESSNIVTPMLTKQ